MLKHKVGIRYKKFIEADEKPIRGSRYVPIRALVSIFVREPRSGRNAYTGEAEHRDRSNVNAPIGGS